MLSGSRAVGRLPRRTLVSFLLALIVLALGSGVGLAHSNLERSDPPAGAILRQAPAEVRLWFSEDLEPRFSRAVVYDESRQVVSTDSGVATSDPRLLVVDLGPGLTTGWYVVSWQAQARVDGHLTRGVVAFGIGVSGPPPGIATAARSAENGSGSALDVALRWLILLSAIVVVGSWAFWILQGQTISQGRRSATRWRILPAQWAVAELAWIVFMLANLTFLTNAVAEVTETPSLDDLGPPLVLLATRTAFGQLWLARMALAGVLGFILLYRGNDCPSRWDGPALALGAGLLLCFSLASHSAAVSGFAPVAVANDWLHFAAVNIWIGGVVQLAIVFAVWPGRSARGDGKDVRWLLARRFGTLATYSVALVVVTGFSEALYHVATPFNLVNSSYGRVVLLKTLLAAPLAVAAVVHRRLIRAVLAPERQADLPPVLARLVGIRPLESLIARSIGFEALWAVVVIAAVGLLTSLSPP